MTPASNSSGIKAPANDVDVGSHEVEKQCNHSSVAPRLSSREEETQPLLARLPPRPERPSATNLKVTYFLIRAADHFGMSWAVKQLLQRDLGTVLNALEFEADDNVLKTFTPEKGNLTVMERKTIRTLMGDLSLAKALFFVKFLHPELNAAVESQDIDAIKRLLPEIQDLENRNFLAGAFLMIAIAHNRMNSATALIDGGASLDDSVFKQSTALIFSVQRGRREVTEKLIALAKCNDKKIPANYLNLKNGNGYTALVLTASKGDTAVFKALLDAGADTKITCLGYAAFQYALYHCTTSICSAYIDHIKPDTAAKAMTIVDDAIRLFQWPDPSSVNPGNSLEFTVRKLCRDYIPQHNVNDFVKNIIARLLNDRVTNVISNIRPPVQAVFDAITQLTPNDLKTIKANFAPAHQVLTHYTPQIEDYKYFIQDCCASPWAIAFGHFQNDSFDEFDRILFTKATGIVNQQEYKPDVDNSFNLLFLSLEQIRGASTSQELKAAYIPVPGHILGKLINVPIRAKELAQTLREELKANKARTLRLVDDNGKNIDLDDKDELNRLEIQLFAFEVENILTEIANNVPAEPQKNKTLPNGENHDEAQADYQQRLVASQQASDLLQGLQPASANAASFHLRLLGDQHIDALLQEVGSGMITVDAALEKLDAAQEDSGLLAVLESDTFAPLRAWAIPQFLAPAARISDAGNKAGEPSKPASQVH